MFVHNYVWCPKCDEPPDEQGQLSTARASDVPTGMSIRDVVWAPLTYKVYPMWHNAPNKNKP
jgi:hypothetical protein